MIYIYERNKDDGIILEMAGKLLSRERMEKLERYKFRREKELCCMSFLLLRYGLAREYGMTGLPDICIGRYGKPYLRDSSVSFNISHCCNSVLCSISGKDTGADIQDYNKNILSIKDRILSAEESRIIASRKESVLRELARFWTLKEAYGKYHGFGLGYNYFSTDFSSVKSSKQQQSYDGLVVYSECFDRYAVSVFSEEPLELKLVPSQELYSAAEKIIL